MNPPDISKLRYIVFLIDTKIKDHDGKIYTSYKDAKQFCANTMKEKYADKAVIGMFQVDTNIQEMNISMIETIGFPNDKKAFEQIDLFKPSKTK
jgi:hypothetical protein